MGIVGTGQTVGWTTDGNGNTTAYRGVVELGYMN